MLNLGFLFSQIFASIAAAVLYLTGWKKSTVAANLRHTQVAKPTVGFYKKLLKNLAHHVGEMLFDFNKYKTLPEDTRAYPCVKNSQSFELSEGAAAVIEKMRKGGIFLTAHYGNYEASGAWLCALGVPLKASFIPLKPDWLNKIVYGKIRSVRGRAYSVKASTPRDFLRILDEGELFCLLSDQDSRIGSALQGTFLGKPVSHNPVPDFLLKHRPNTPVFFCWIEEIDERGKTKDERGFAGKLKGLTKRKILHAEEVAAHDPLSSIVDGPYKDWLEARIQENPAQWYGWTHRRFRSQNHEIYK